MKTIEIAINHRKELRKELDKFIQGMPTKSIQALADKIEHMVNNIGCPESVKPMLLSIINGNVKAWGEGGKQLGKRTKLTHSGQNEYLLIGHFREHGFGYVLTAEELNHVKNFFFAGEEVLMKVDESNEYEKQAFDFVKRHNIDFIVKLLKKDKYFSDDKEERNIYEIKLSRKRKEYVFTFGQSINATKTGEAPTYYDILACLTKYEVGTFEDFCADFGYDEDSRTAEKTYKAVCEEWTNVERLFGDILEELQEIN